MESEACWEQERLAAPPSPVSHCEPSDRIRNSSSNRFVLRLNICWTELKRTSELRASWAVPVMMIILSSHLPPPSARLAWDWDCHETEMNETSPARQVWSGAGLELPPDHFHPPGGNYVMSHITHHTWSICNVCNIATVAQWHSGTVAQCTGHNVCLVGTQNTQLS